MILFIHSCPKVLRVSNALSTRELCSEEGKGSGCPELRGWQKVEMVAGGTAPASSAWCSRPGGRWPRALERVEGCARGGLAPLFSACLFSAPARMSVLLLVCLFQASVMWRFIHFQLRRWREYWNEQSSRKRAAATASTKQQAKPLKRDSGECRDWCTVGWHRGRHQSRGSASPQQAAARAGSAAAVPPALC